uniref:C2H2-type domain-containing protein n=1 Tax=Cyprinus carpio TaxID=7962 RepID=A0A8C2HPE7_CYPCA
MAESETDCDTPGLDTLGSECVIAHTQVGDLHYGAETEIMTQEDKRLDLEAIHGDLGAVTCVDVVTETDHDYIKSEIHHDHHHYFSSAEIKGNEHLLGEVLLKTEIGGGEHIVKVESDHGGELTVESENGVIIHEAHGLQCSEEHMKMHSDDTPYKCTQCRQSGVRRRHLKQHQELHAHDKPFTCLQCGKGFTTASNLKQHQKTHAGEKPHRCTQCGKCFAAAATLREHQRIHSGEKPYKCTQCRKSFVRKRHLKKHQLVHQGGKPYRCSQCDKGFNHSSSLSRHHKRGMHTGKGFPHTTILKQRILQSEKPYRCSSLSRHHRIHIDHRLGPALRELRKSSPLTF